MVAKIKEMVGTETKIGFSMIMKQMKTKELKGYKNAVMRDREEWEKMYWLDVSKRQRKEQRQKWEV